jgi:hypothetical protein
VACGARDFLVSAGKGKSGALVIEERRPPFVCVVATCAVVLAGAELMGMRVLMTIAALDRSFREIDPPHRELHIRRLVTLGARNRAMRTHQWERGLTVVKTLQVFPLSCRVAGLASDRFS